MSRESFSTLQQMVIQAATELNLDAQAGNVLSSSDRTTRQLAAFCNTTIKELTQRFPWSTTIGTNPFVLKQDGSYVFKCTADDDKPLIDSDLIINGIKWRFLHSKGLTYDEEFRSYEKTINYYAFEQNRGKDVNTNVAATSAIRV